MRAVSEFLLYTGCLIPARFLQAEATARFVLDKLGVDYADARGLTCCPDPVVYRSASDTEWLTLAAANLAKAANQAPNLLTLCSGCYETFTEAAHRLENADTAHLVNERLKKAGLSYQKPPRIVHFARFLAENTEKIAHKLNGEVKLKAALFYGCHILKPSSLMNPDSLRSPSFLNRVPEVCGVELVEWDNSLCCGKGSLNQEVGRMLARRVVEAAKQAGAEALIVVCPFCFAGLDGAGDIPVLFLQQVVAAAMGAEPALLGLNTHRIKFALEVRQHARA